MHRIQVEGGRITIPPSPSREIPVVLRFGEQLKSWREEPDGFVIEQSIPNSNRTWIQKRSYSDGGPIWTLAIDRARDLEVSPDNRTITVEDSVSIQLPSDLLYARRLSEEVVVLVHPNAQVGNRNLFLYDRAGRRKWQVQQWPRFQNFYIENVSDIREVPFIPAFQNKINAIVGDRTEALFAVLLNGGQALIVNRLDGAILDQINWKA